MTTLLYFKKSPNSKVTRKTSSTLRAGFSTLALMLINLNALTAQTSQEVPVNNVSGTFFGPYANNNRIYQMIIDDTQLTSLSGKYLTSISFRLAGSATAAWPAADTTFPSYEIFLSNGVNPADKQSNFAANVVGVQTQVRAGILVVPTGALPAASNPNPFTFNITFDTPYLFTGTNLVIEIRHTGSDGATGPSHAVTSTSTSAGYGTLFAAVQQNGANSPGQGNFTYVKINSIDVLGVKSVEIDGGLSVYPNPVKDYLTVKSAKEIAEFHVYNMVGQKVYTQKNSSKDSQLNVTNLAKGSYILQMIDNKGNSSSTRFIKE